MGYRRQSRTIQNLERLQRSYSIYLQIQNRHILEHSSYAYKGALFVKSGYFYICQCLNFIIILTRSPSAHTVEYLCVFGDHKDLSGALCVVVLRKYYGPAVDSVNWRRSIVKITCGKQVLVCNEVLLADNIVLL